MISWERPDGCLATSVSSGLTTSFGFSWIFFYAVTLFVAVLVSGIAERSVLSPAVLFLTVGFFIRLGVWIELQPDGLLVETLTNVALFSVLFTDGMRIGIDDLKSAGRLPGRALLLGMPLTMLAIAAKTTRCYRSPNPPTMSLFD